MAVENHSIQSPFTLQLCVCLFQASKSRVYDHLTNRTNYIVYHTPRLPNQKTKIDREPHTAPCICVRTQLHFTAPRSTPRAQRQPFKASQSATAEKNARSTRAEIETKTRRDSSWWLVPCLQRSSSKVKRTMICFISFIFLNIEDEMFPFIPMACVKVS